MSRSKQPIVEWKEVVAATNDGVAILEGERVVHVDDRFAAVFGFGESTTLEGRSWETLFSQKARERLESEILPIARREGEWQGQISSHGTNGGDSIIEVTARAPDSEVIILTARGAGQEMTRSDITDQDNPNHGQRFDSTPVPIGVITDEGGIVYANNAALEFLGADEREDILGKSPETFINGGTPNRIRSRIDSVLEEQASTSPLEQHFVTLDGEERVAIVSAAPTTFDGTPAVEVVLTDITEYAERRDRLERETRFVRTLLDAIDDILFVIDGNGEPYLWNETLAETTGYTDAEIETMAPGDFLPESGNEDIPGFMETIEATDDRRVEFELLTKDGELIPHEFRGTTFEDPVSGEVFRCGLARDITERRERDRELERYENIVETVDDGVYALDEDLRFSFVNEGLCRLLDTSRDELLGKRVDALFDREAELDVAAEIRERVLKGDSEGAAVQGTYQTPEGERIYEANYRLQPEGTAEFQGSVGVIRDMTEKLERERALERQRDELSTLNRINELLFGLIHGLVEAQDRDAIERLVCDQLVESELFQFVWTGEYTLDDRIAPRMSAGEGDGFLEALMGSEGELTAGDTPAVRAISTTALQVETVESEDADGWRQIARDHGFESLIAVPLHHRETVYGVLVVYAGRSDAFSERERHGFEVLGKTVGLALDAIERRRLLFADAVTELELRVTAPGSFLSQASEEFECRLSVSEYVSVEDHWHLFVDIDDGDIGTLADYASHHPAVEGRKVISTDGGPDRLEVVVGEGSIFDHIVPTGVDIRSLKFHGGLGMVVVDAPAEVAVREVVEKLHSTFQSVELLSRQEKDRPIEPSRDRSETVDMLTERQREVLKVAYYAGYFSWPRANTAETIAEMLGIAAPTFHAHIRKAEDVLLSNVFE